MKIIILECWRSAQLPTLH